MAARFERGVRWFMTVMLYIVIFSALKAVFAFSTPDIGKGLATALMTFLGFCLIVGLPAFVLGYLTGGSHPNGE